jgi:type III pantothenate kinase
MQSGLYYGYVALVDGIITRMKKELGPNTRVIGTGGQAPFIAQDTKLIETVDPNITLDGLKLVSRQALPSLTADSVKMSTVRWLLSAV